MIWELEWHECGEGTVMCDEKLRKNGLVANIEMKGDGISKFLLER